MANSWSVKEKISEKVAERLGEYPKVIKQLLYNRGISDLKTAKLFLETPYEEGLSSPFLFRGMEKTADRIMQAIEKNELVYVYGDYDADAVTASAVLLLTLSYLGLQAKSYIPDRFTEGYGVNLDALEKIKNEGAKLIVTVDCGTNATDAAEFCSRNNIDFIITDHHEILGEKPQAFSLVNPKNPEENYPNKDLTGVGVAFKVAQAVIEKYKIKNPNTECALGWEKWLLDLVAIGTVADCHSLLGENRILVKYGLKVLAKTKWIGLRALFSVANLNLENKSPDTYTLGFVIAPRLNAAGRLEHAGIALNLLMETDEVSAQERAAALEIINQKRQGLTQNVLSEAREQALQLTDRKILLLHGKNWPKGVVGLVAGRIAEEFCKPTIVLEEDEFEATGSARTFGNFDILGAINFAREDLLRYGGHKQAAGLTLLVKNISSFYAKLLTFCQENEASLNSVKELSIEHELEHEDLLADTVKEVFDFEPHGVGNNKPKFLLKQIKIISVRRVGKTGEHVQFKFTFGNADFSGIAFSVANYVKIFTIGNVINMVAELVKDDWNGGFKFRFIDFKLN